MAIVTATQVTVYSDISASAATITASGLIPVVQERINWICNNYFTTDLYVRTAVAFDSAAKTITATGVNFETEGFIDDDEIYIYRSYRNDGYYTVSDVSASVLTVLEDVTPEKSGRSVLLSVVLWPADLKYTAAQMVAYDYDKRAERTAGVSSVRLGPWSESYAEPGSGEFGYPADILAPLYDHRIARLM